MRIKLNISVFSVFLFLFLVSKSENGFKDSNEIYTYWAKRGIIEMTYAYMNDYCQSSKCNDSELKGIEAYKEGFINSLDTISVNNIDSLFDKVSSFLINNHWKRTNNQIFEKLKQNLELNLDFLSMLFAIKIENITLKEWIKTKNRITANYINAQSVSLPNNIPTYSQNDDGELFENRKKNLLSNVIFIIIVFFFIGAIIVFIWLINKYYKDIKILERKINSLEKEKSNPVLAKDSQLQSKPDFSNKVKQKQEQMQTVNLEEQPNTSSEKDIVKPSESINKDIQNIQYYRYPNENHKCFFIEHKTDKNDPSVFYKIKHADKENIGELFFIEESTNNALQQIDTVLIPTCNIQNPEYAYSAKKIEVLSNGKVELKGDRWVIIEKIKIKFI